VQFRIALASLLYEAELTVLYRDLNPATGSTT